MFDFYILERINWHTINIVIGKCESLLIFLISYKSKIDANFNSKNSVYNLICIGNTYIHLNDRKFESASRNK